MFHNHEPDFLLLFQNCHIMLLIKKEVLAIRRIFSLVDIITNNSRRFHVDIYKSFCKALDDG